MLSRLHNLRALLLLVLISTLLSACASAPSGGPLLIGRKPQQTPLPAAILQIDLQPSTSTLSAGAKWLQDSEKILSSETPK